MSQNENMYVEETEEQRMRRNKKEEEACLQMLIEANIENDLLIEARAAARARAAMEEVERQKQLHELREREEDLAKLRKRKLLDHGVKHGWWVLSEQEKKRRRVEEWWVKESEEEETEEDEDEEEHDKSLSRKAHSFAALWGVEPKEMLATLLGQVEQKKKEILIAKRSQEMTMYKGEKWYKLFLIAKAKDERLVVPPEPDPSDCSITKRQWNKAVFKWKHDTIAVKFAEFAEFAELAELSL